MIAFKRLSLQEFLKSYPTLTPTQKEMEHFQEQITQMLQGSQSHHREKSQEQEISEFLNTTFAYRCRSRDNIDLAILQEGRVSVILEVKALGNKNEFPSSPDNPLSKALYEAILYFLRETYKEHNNSIKHIILCTPSEFFVFDATKFLIFSSDKHIKTLYKNCDEKEGTDKSTERFYNDLHFYLSTAFSQEILYTYFSLSSPHDLPLIYTLLSPQVLLKSRNTIDANTLNQGFYEELLYILGLQEESEGSKILIRPSSTPNSLTSSILREYPNLSQEEVFTLITTWNNRILFLALLESMLLSFKHIEKPFLDIASIPDFPTLGVLFFEVLAKKATSRSTSLPHDFASIPYLNSSLFDRIPLECGGKDIKSLTSLPLPLFSRSILKKSGKKELPLLEYFFEFLHAYDFTTTPKDIKEGVKQNHDKLINSAVLGLVFEKLNGYKEGSFYTPSFITSFMCKQSITQATLEKYNATYGWECQNLKDLIFTARFSKVSEEDLLSTLLSLKICDPSVGSGHFLVSALNEIIYIAYSLGLFQHLHPSLILEIENDEILLHTKSGEYFCYTKPTHPQDHLHKLQEEIFNLKKSIIENCLFGVDINPNSCEITKLRLWIELLKYSYYIFDENGKNTNALETLPNIDINIKCGNSLISRFSLDDKLNKIPNIKKKIKEYKELVSLYKNPDPLFPLSKSSLESKIAELKALFSLTLKDPKTKSELEKAIKHHFTLYNDFALDDESLLEGLSVGEKNLFGTPSLSEEEQENAFASYGRIKALRKKLDTALSGAEYHDAFEWRFEFPEVLDSEGNFLGFDCVIGNPPYIRQELIKDLKPTLSKKYEIYKGTSDIYTYFFERGYHLLTPQGILSFITSNKWARAGYGEALREFILRKTSFLYYIDLNGENVFESASVDTSITTFSKSSPTPSQQVAYLPNSQDLTDPQYELIPQSSLSTQTLTFSSSSIMALKEKIERVGTPLKEWDISIFRGVLTGYNDAFIIDTPTRDKILSKCKTQEERKATEQIIKKMLRGRDIKRYSYEWADLWLIGTFPSLKLNINDYPSLKSYLSQFRPRINQSGEKGCRKKTNNQWFETQDNIAYCGEFDKEKIVYSEIVREPQFYLDTSHFFAEATSFILTGHNLKYLLGLLNSPFVGFIFKTFYAGGGLGEKGYRYKKAFLENLPIPKITKSNQPTADKIIALVEEILALKESNPQSPTQELESQINSLVYTLYNLTEEEIKIIEKSRNS